MLALMPKVDKKNIEDYVSLSNQHNHMVLQLTRQLEDSLSEERKRGNRLRASPDIAHWSAKKWAEHVRAQWGESARLGELNIEEQPPMPMEVETPAPSAAEPVKQEMKAEDDAASAAAAVPPVPEQQTEAAKEEPMADYDVEEEKPVLPGFDDGRDDQSLVNSYLGGSSSLDEGWLQASAAGSVLSMTGSALNREPVEALVREETIGGVVNPAAVMEDDAETRILVCPAGIEPYEVAPTAL